VTIRLADGRAVVGPPGTIRLAARVAPAREGPPAVNGTATLQGIEAPLPMRHVSPTSSRPSS
jgi:hypothetical protein